MKRRWEPQWWAWVVENAPATWVGRPQAPGFRMADLARLMGVTRGNVWSCVREGATVEWVARVLVLLEGEGWPRATLQVTGGVMSVSTAGLTLPDSEE